MDQTNEYIFLIVDDSESDRRIYRRWLTKEQSQPFHYQLIEVESGEEALLWCQENSFDLLLIDYNLPDMTGLELLQQLKVRFQLDKIPAIILTGQGSTEIAVELLKNGAEDYFDKNQLTEDILKRSIWGVLKQFQLVKQLKQSEQEKEAALQQLNQALEKQVKKRTLALHESEKHNRTILEAIPDLLLHLNRQGIRLNTIKPRTELEKFFPIVENIAEVLPPELLQKQLYMIEQAIATQELQVYEHEFVRDGQTHYEEVRILALNDEEVLAIVRDISDRKQAEAALQQQARQEQLLFAVSQAIRQSLNLEIILETATQKVREILQVDRATIYRFNADWSGDFIVESVGPAWVKLIEKDKTLTWKDTCLQTTQGGRFRQQQSYFVSDIYAHNLHPCHINLLESLQTKACAVSPIFSGESLWGLFAIYQNTAPRYWQTWEIELLEQIGVQLAIAIQQSALYEQLQQELKERQQAEQALAERIEELKQRNSEMSLLSEMSDFLQACITVEEACRAVTSLIPPLFPHCSGGIAMINNSRNYLETLSTWGMDTYSASLFESNDCWALRRGKLHFVAEQSPHLCCNHIKPTHPPVETLCIPMVAQGETLGLFYLCSSHPDQLSEAKRQLACAIAEQISAVIANLILREKLEHQSIRDPLTGLFNRRYLEEFLNKEIHRAIRHQYSIGIIMLDIDHFKQFNDLLGHDAGDYVLKEIGYLLQKMIRISDVACRYGGEEMTIILPETSLETTTQKAETIREMIAQLQLNYQGQPMKKLTASLGVATFPEQGTAVNEVIHAADMALYRAKEAGRNQVIVYGD
ncbi:MAG: diguanylate cyclase [Snowella sp.]|nr:diguanylate cyclase [Snowella sp.]